ncbi:MULTISPECIES: hypothetical protein [Mycolicibacterium]|uniref:hypothetical protein n=1 Tax=Mycolicibacterium TaxID=1866885 RepID=UPI0009FFEF9F|nr:MULTISPECIES: hypothetical protein [Mycolicibacterium]QZY45434.1 hypothetical protein K5L12_25095 [Mycolicibacterium austroafricanum]UJL29195.1 hypothetical protein HZU38_01230 [Mycolicibacterium vanbaalenii]WND55921.1 hypothetical protein QQA43_24935 [Mycolicibacterium vanbaalenii]
MRRVGIAALAAAAAMMAGCSAPSQAPPPSTPSSAVPSVGHGSFAYCLSQHGVPAAPGPVSEPPPGMDAATWEAAMSECSSLAPGPAG